MNTWQTSSGGKITAESRTRAEELARQYGMGKLVKREGRRTDGKERALHVSRLLECLEPRFRFEWLFKNADDWAY